MYLNINLDTAIRLYTRLSMRDKGEAKALEEAIKASPWEGSFLLGQGAVFDRTRTLVRIPLDKVASAALSLEDGDCDLKDAVLKAISTGVITPVETADDDDSYW